MLKQQGALLAVRLADDSGDAGFSCSAFQASVYVNLANDTARYYFGSATSAYPSLKRSGAVLHIRLADDSAYAGIVFTEEVTLATPTTGQTVTLGDDARNQAANITPAGTLAALTIAFPSNANSINGQQVSIFINQIITTLTLSSSGATFLNGVSAWVANDCITFKKFGTTWVRKK